MLNELHTAAKAIDNCGIVTKDVCVDLKTLPKAPCYRIVLKADGSVQNVSSIDAKLALTLRKYEKNNGVSFPGFNLCALYRIDDEKTKTLLQRWRSGRENIDVNIVRGFCIPRTYNWHDKTFKKLEKCLGIAQKLDDEIGEFLSDNESLFRMFQAVKKIGDVENFCKNFEAVVWEKFTNPSAKLLQLLIHEGTKNEDPKKVEADIGSISFFLDVENCDTYPVAHEKTIGRLNELLLKKEASKKSDGCEKNDAYNSPLESDWDGKFPKVKLDSLAEVILRSQVSAIPCQGRYSLLEGFAFPVGKKMRMQMKSAIEYISSPKKRRVTWGSAGSKEIVFAFPTSLSKMTIPLISMFGSAPIQVDPDAKFEKEAKSVIEELYGLERDLSKVELTVFALRKMDKARTKVVYYRNYSAQKLETAAKAWIAGFKNIPEISLDAWGKQKGEKLVLKPEPLFPLAIHKFINPIWKQTGERAGQVKSCVSTVGLDLLLENENYQFCKHLLSVLLRHGKGLLLHMCHSTGQQKMFDNKLQENVVVLPGLLGLLLAKMGIKKEKYMTNTAFLMGQFLRVVDEIHYQYCEKVRNGGKPPQLAGNSMLSSALNSPVQALSQLAQRFRPYSAWSRIYSGDDSGWVHYLRGLHGKISAQLAQTLTTTRLSDEERAQLFLGYLADLPKKSDLTNVNEAKGE